MKTFFPPGAPDHINKTATQNDMHIADMTNAALIT